MNRNKNMTNSAIRTNLNPLAALVMLAVPMVVLAAGPVVPDAGSILQQLRPSLVPAPSSSQSGLLIEQPAGAALPVTAPFRVTTIRITGNTSFEMAALHALVADAEGQTLTLTELLKVAARITDYYQKQGYPLARAVIPAQTIRVGIVEIAVIEARYGKISIKNGSQVDTTVLQAVMDPLQPGQVIEQGALERSLLLLSDIQGVATSATLKPGSEIGTSDLEVQEDPTAAVVGNLALDNDGNQFTGRMRLGGTMIVNNPLHHADMATVSVLTSGNNMKYARLGYETLVHGAGTRVGGSYSALDYRLGDSLSQLDGHGSAGVGSLWLKHPFIRTPGVNLNGQIQYEQKGLRDGIDSTGIHTDRHLNNWTASVSGDVRDRFLSGGISSWSLVLTSGRVGFDDAAALLANTASANTQGSFNKWTASFARLQNVSASSGLYLSLSAQAASTNLDPAEKMVAGGPYSVRAYDMGVLSGDSGYQASVEWRVDLGSLWQGQMQAVAFVDSEHITINKNPWAAGLNDARLSGAGVGLDWSGPDQWKAGLLLASPVGGKPELLGTTSLLRAWIQISKGF